MKNRIRVVRNYSLLALVAAVAAPLACGSKETPPPNTAQNPGYGGSAAPVGAPGYPQQQPGYGQPGYAQQPAPQQGYAPQPQGYPQQPAYPPQPQPGAPPQAGGMQPAPQGTGGPLGPVVTNDPNQLSQIFAQAAQAAGAVLQTPGAAPANVVDAGIKLAALKYAPGMQPEGQEATGTLQEGGHLAFMVPMQAGKCYTLIGFSPLGQIKNVDLNLLAPPFYTVMAGQDTTDDNLAVIGKGTNPMCPIVPVALNYKVDIVARKGAGQVGVQLFSKSK